MKNEFQFGILNLKKIIIPKIVSDQHMCTTLDIHNIVTISLKIPVLFNFTTK